MSTSTPRTATGQLLRRKLDAVIRYSPGFGVEVIIFWVMLEAFQQLKPGA